MNNIVRKMLGIIFLVIAVCVVFYSQTISSFNASDFEMPDLHVPSVSEYTYYITGTSSIACIFNATLSYLANDTDVSSLMNSYIANDTVFFIDEGKYVRSSSVEINGLSNISIYGCGNSTFSLNDNDLPSFIIQNSESITISGLGEMGSGTISTASNTCFRMFSNTGVTIQYCNIQDFGYDGVHDLYGSNGTIVRYNIVLDCYDDGINIGGHVNAGPFGALVYSNYVSGMYHDGIHVSIGSEGTEVYDNTVLDCEVGVGFINAVYSSVHDCKFWNLEYGIYEYTENCDYNLIFDCSFYDVETPSVFEGRNSQEFGNTWKKS